MTSSHAMKRALVVGIDAYQHRPLTSCGRDAERVHALLSRHADGSKNFESRLVTDAYYRLDRDTLWQLARTLLSHEADVAALYFAGHGGVDDEGGYIRAREREGDAPGSERLRMADLLELAHGSPVREIIVLLDCCSAGAFANLGGGRHRAVLDHGLTIIAAARPDQEALEQPEGGVFTSLLCEALAGGAADVRGQVTMASAYAYLHESLGAWDQRPLLKAHVSRLVPLRACAAAVSDDILRRLPQWFPLAHDAYALDPAHEPSCEPIDPERESVFAALQKCRAAKLVEPLGYEHMFEAAVSRGACRLTPLGRHYHRMVVHGHL
jgi:hypothetical protein